MSRALDLAGETFGLLYVEDFAGSIKEHGRTYRYWYCKCKCGNDVLVRTGDLRQGRKSCGCLKGHGDRTTHGGAKRTNGKLSPEYSSWSWMKHSSKDLYEGWKDFQNFINDIGPRPSDKHKLDRRDRTQPHGPNNTYWRNYDKQQTLSEEFCIDMRFISDTD